MLQAMVFFHIVHLRPFLFGCGESFFSSPIGRPAIVGPVSCDLS